MNQKWPKMNQKCPKMFQKWPKKPKKMTKNRHKIDKKYTYLTQNAAKKLYHFIILGTKSGSKMVRNVKRGPKNVF